MAITAIEIIQDNLVNGCELLSVHNPLVFIARATFTGDKPDYLYVNINSVQYKAIYLRDESLTERDFYFIADEVLRKELGKIEDINQTTDTILSISNLSKELTIEFSDGDLITDSVTFTAVNGARDFESLTGAEMVAECDNESKYYIAAVGEKYYLYWYNDDANNDIISDININNIPIYATKQLTIANMGTALVNEYPDNLSYNAVPPAGKMFCNKMQGGGGVNEGFEFDTYLTGTITNIVVSPAFSYELLELTAGRFNLEITIPNNPVDGEGFSFDCQLTGYPSFSIVGTFDSPTVVQLSKGFIRKAITPTATGLITESILINGVLLSHSVNVKSMCSNGVLLKYLDRNGQYRVIPFVSLYTRKSSPQNIGDVNEFVLSLVDDKGDTRRIGYKNKDTLNLTCPLLNETEIGLMKDLFCSSDVCIKLNGKWVRCYVSGDNFSKIGKRGYKDLNISVELPQSYNITEL